MGQLKAYKMKPWKWAGAFLEVRGTCDRRRVRQGVFGNQGRQDTRVMRRQKKTRNLKAGRSITRKGFLRRHMENRRMMRNTKSTLSIRHWWVRRNRMSTETSTRQTHRQKLTDGNLTEGFPNPTTEKAFLISSVGRTCSRVRRYFPASICGRGHRYAEQ